MIGAILRAQWLSMRMFRAGPGRRGALFAALIGAVWYGLWGVAGWGVYELLREATRAELKLTLPWGFLGVMAYWQLAPVLSASFGAALDFRKLRLYPVPHRRLFAVEVLLRLTTAGEMLLVLAGGAAGLVAGGHARGPWVCAAALLFIACNVLLGSGLRSLLERLLSRRYVREAMVLVFVMMASAPRFFMLRGWRAAKAAPYVDQWFWPWQAAASTALGREGLEAAVLCGWVALAGLFGRWQFERSLRFDVAAAHATAAPGARRSPLFEWLFRLPGLVLRDPEAAVVEKELRSLSRTPRFRMVFVMGFTFGILVCWSMLVGQQHSPNGTSARSFPVVASIYALTLLGQVSYLNAFGFDRSAAQWWFSAPVPVARTLAGKNIAAVLFIYLEITAVFVASLAMRIEIPPARMLETALAVGIAALYMLGLGNLSTVHYPRGMNPERVSQGGASSRLQGLIFVFYPLALLPLLVAYLARYAFESETIFYVLLAVAGAMGGVVYRVALRSSIETAVRRREQILQALGRGEGPVAEA